MGAGVKWAATSRLDPAILARYRTAAEELVVEIQRVGREFRAQFPGLGDS